jgi:hypothetical protein
MSCAFQVVFQNKAPVAENKPDLVAMLASASGEKAPEDDTPELMRKPFQFLSVLLLR